MEQTDPALPAPITVPTRTAAAAPAGSAAQQEFRLAILAVENLRAQLRDLRTAQDEARRRYWQQVGPVATDVVAARRALFAPLEEALLLVYFSRLEEQQLTQLILSNARALEERFGEPVPDILQKYAPTDRRTATDAATGQPASPEAAAEYSFVPDPDLLPHEQAAAEARARRRTKAQRQQEAAAQAALADQQQLEASAKTIYRQLARTHHPDLERDPAKQAHRTALMQRITEAYEADDLFALLELLAESAPADAASDEVLARYTQALRQLLARLRTPSDLRDFLRELAAEGLESF